MENIEKCKDETVEAHSVDGDTEGEEEQSETTAQELEEEIFLKEGLKAIAENGRHERDKYGSLEWERWYRKGNEYLDHIST